jgi:hypothetical protein
MKKIVWIEIDTEQDIPLRKLVNSLEISLGSSVNVKKVNDNRISIIDRPQFSDVEIPASVYKRLKAVGKSRGLSPLEVINGGARRLGIDSSNRPK